MITLRKAAARGRTQLDWLDSRHTFSFGGYYDPAHNGFSVLRVINDDRIAAGRGFATHPHRDMEIITYVMEGAVEHRDSVGNHGLVTTGEVQRMTAGTGIEHSEANPSPTELLHLLQIWILPRERGLTPGYEQRRLPRDGDDGFVTVAAPQGENGALTIHQDVAIYSGRLKKGGAAIREIASGRQAYVQVVRGALTLARQADQAGVTLEAADGAQISGETRLHMTATADTELLLFDLP